MSAGPVARQRAAAELVRRGVAARWRHVSDREWDRWDTLELEVLGRVTITCPRESRGVVYVSTRTAAPDWCDTFGSVAGGALSAAVDMGLDAVPGFGGVVLEVEPCGRVAVHLGSAENGTGA